MAISRFDTPAPYIQQYIPQSPIFDIASAAPVFEALQQEWNSFSAIPDMDLASTPGDLEEVARYREKLRGNIDEIADKYHKEGVVSGRKAINKTTKDIGRELKDPNSKIYKIQNQAAIYNNFREELSKNENINPTDKLYHEAFVNLQAQMPSFDAEGKFHPIKTPWLLDEKIEPLKFIKENVWSMLEKVKDSLGENVQIKELKREDGTIGYGFVEQGHGVDPERIMNAMAIAVNTDPTLRKFLEYEAQYEQIYKATTGENPERRGSEHTYKMLLDGIASAFGYKSYDILKMDARKEEDAVGTYNSNDPFGNMIHVATVSVQGYDKPIASSFEDFNSLYKDIVLDREKTMYDIGEVVDGSADKVYMDNSGEFMVPIRSKVLKAALSSVGITNLEATENYESHLNLLSEMGEEGMKGLRRYINIINPNIAPDAVEEIANKMMNDFNSNILRYNEVVSYKKALIKEELELANAAGDIKVAEHLNEILTGDLYKKVTPRNFEDHHRYNKEYIPKIKAEAQILGTPLSSRMGYESYMKFLTEDTTTNRKYASRAIKNLQDKNFVNLGVISFLPTDAGINFSTLEKMTPLQQLEVGIKNRALPKAQGGSMMESKNLDAMNIIPVSNNSVFKDKARNVEILNSNDLNRNGVLGVEYSGLIFHDGKMKAYGTLITLKNGKPATGEPVVYEPTADINDNFLEAIGSSDVSYIASWIKTNTNASKMDHPNKTALWNTDKLISKENPVTVTANEGGGYTIKYGKQAPKTFNNLLEASIALNNLIIVSRPPAVIGDYAPEVIKDTARIQQNKADIQAYFNTVNPDLLKNYFPSFKGDIASAMTNLIKIESAGTYDSRVQSLESKSKALSSAIGLFQNTIATLPPGYTPVMFRDSSPAYQIQWNMERLSRAANNLNKPIRNAYDLYLINFSPVLYERYYNNQDMTVNDAINVLGETTMMKNRMFYDKRDANPTLVEILQTKMK
jgi:hypothetical protein